jgi:general secretion pathway protein D
MRVLVLSFGLIAGLVGCATAKIHDEGMADVQSGRYEQGLAKLEQAVADSPDNMTYRLDLKGRREESIRRLLADGDRARGAGSLDQAEVAYQRVLTIEPGNDRAARGIELLKRDRRQAEMLAQASKEYDQGLMDSAEAKVHAVLTENPGSAGAQLLQSRIDTARGPRNTTPRLKTRDNKPVSLQFRDASTKMVFEVLSRQTGLNFIFDKDVKSDGKTTIFVDQVPVEQAIDLVLGQNQLGRQVLSDNMVLIYPNTPAKQKEYRDEIVRTFYLTNGDPKRVMDMLKTMLDAKTLFVDERARAVVMRDTPEAIRMAERLISSVDVAEAEVLLEVEVLELTRTRLQQLGINYPSQVTFSPTPLAGEPLVIADFKAQDSTTIQVSPVSLTVDLRKEVSTSNLLASPRIRARNHEQAKILIGQRVPVITNSVTPTAGGTSVVTGQVQYVDVGLALEVQPEIYIDNDVAIKVNLEVSNIIRAIENAQSGTLAYQIGTRNASTLLRLKDGETQVLAGLIQDTDRTTSNHIPGLGDLPVLGRLFGTQNDDGEKTEIVMSITPRVIRAQPRPPSENIEFYYGTESSLRSAPIGAGGTSAAATGSGGGRSGVVRSAAATPTDQAATDEPADEAAAAKPMLALEGPAQVAVGEEFDVSFSLSSGSEIATMRSVLRFDPSALQVVSADFGGLIPEEARGAGVQVGERDGRIRFDIQNLSLSGEGEVLSVRFKALSPRPGTMVAVQQFGAAGAEGNVLPVMAPKPLILVVTP